MHLLLSLIFRSIRKALILVLQIAVPLTVVGVLGLIDGMKEAFVLFAAFATVALFVAGTLHLRGIPRLLETQREGLVTEGF